MEWILVIGCISFLQMRSMSFVEVDLTASHEYVFMVSPFLDMDIPGLVVEDGFKLPGATTGGYEGSSCGSFILNIREKPRICGS